MKVFIMTDLEGASGVNGRSAGIGNKIVNEATACNLLLGEVNAVIEGLLRGGATEIVVWDGHGGSNSLDIAKLHEAASLGTLGGDMAPVNLLDASFHAAVQIGTHGLQGTREGYLNHSYNSHSVADMHLNGVRVGEIGMMILMASYFNVPTILVAGDTVACLEAKEFIGEGGVMVVETKKSISRYSVVNYNPVKVRKELSANAQKALGQISSMKLKKFTAPYKCKIQFMCSNIADIYEMNGAERLDYQTIVLHSDDFIDICAQRCGWGAGVHNRKFNINQKN